MVQVKRLFCFRCVCLRTCWWSSLTLYFDAFVIEQHHFRSSRLEIRHHENKVLHSCWCCTELCRKVLGILSDGVHIQDITPQTMKQRCHGAAACCTLLGSSIKVL